MSGSNQIGIYASTDGISNFSISGVVRGHSWSDLAAKLVDQICQKLAAIVNVGPVIIIGVSAGESRMIPTVNLHDADAIAIVARPVAVQRQSHVAFPGGDGQKQGNRHIIRPRSLIEVPHDAFHPKVAELGRYGQRATHLYNGLAVESDFSRFIHSDGKLIDWSQCFTSQQVRGNLV